MKFTVPLIFTLVTSAYCAIPVPGGTTGALIAIQSNNFRVYHQDTSLGIKEITVGAPTAHPTEDTVIWNGPTRRNTPLAALSWFNSGATTAEVRVYYITPSSTLGEVAYINGKWQPGNDLGFPAAVDSTLLYATKAGNLLIVGYTYADGVLNHAYYEIGIGPWKTYAL